MIPRSAVPTSVFVDGLDEAEFVKILRHELNAQRQRFPNPDLGLAFLGAEVGELARELLHARINGANSVAAAHTWLAVYKAAIRVSTAAMRLALEGDPTIATPPPGFSIAPGRGR